MKRQFRLGVLLFAVLALAAGRPLPAQQEQATAEKAEETQAAQAGAAEKPATHTIKKGPLKIEVDLTGVFEAEKMTPIRLRPEEWSSLEVMEAVEHGTRVEQGAVLVSFDLEDIDQAIKDLESNQKLAELTIQQSKEELAALETSLPADLAWAERAKQIIDEDLKLFLEQLKPLSEKSAHYYLRSATNSLEYTQEELDQLEKMYSADDLTEETEEIILKRARNDVEDSQFYLELAKVRSDQMLSVDLPRQEVALKELARRQDLELQKAKVAIPVGLGKAKLGMEKLQHDFQQAVERLEGLKKDREAMVVKAPAAGTLYYGQCQQGKWSGAPASGRFSRGDTVTANSVFMTIVEPRPAFVRSSTAEKDLGQVKAGVTGTAVPVAFPNLKLKATVSQVAAVPTGDGSFDTKVSVELADDAQAVLPGMTCNVKLVPYSKDDAIAVPASAVFDEADGSSYVYRVGTDGSHQKATVKVGVRTADKVEIVEGLLEGDNILLARPAG